MSAADETSVVAAAAVAAVGILIEPNLTNVDKRRRLRRLTAAPDILRC